MFTEYTFRDRALLTQALTRRSYVNDQHARDTGGHNEPMEFLGDAVIAVLVRKRVCARLPAASEGELHNIYAHFVSRRALAAMARELGLDKVLRTGRGDQLQGIDQQDKAMEDAMEAVAGALFLDGGLDAAEAVLGARLDAALEEALNTPTLQVRDAKSRLQEWCQARGVVWMYEERGVSGPDHQPVFVVCLQLGPRGDDGVGTLGSFEGEGRSKLEAQKAAAAIALAALEGAPTPGVPAGSPSSALHAGPATPTRTSARNIAPNAKNALLERAQHLKLAPPTFETRSGGPSHAPTFEAKVTSDGQSFGPASARAKRDAEVAAAALALDVLDPQHTFDYVGRR